MPVRPPLGSHYPQTFVESGRDAWRLSMGRGDSQRPAVATCQKCVKLNAPPDLFTHTFFESLSCWPYRKPEKACQLAWQFMQEAGIEPLYVKCGPSETETWRRIGRLYF